MASGKVAIVARAPSSRYMAPFTDSDWEIWTLSPMSKEDGFTDIPRLDRWYEIHALDEKECECPGYLGFLKELGSKVWIREPHAELPDANIYPRDEVVEHFQRNFAYPFCYYNNSVSLMMAHAMLEREGNLTDLGLYGVDMCQYEEYAAQAPSCEVFVGIAAGRGIKVHIPISADLTKTARIYGIDDAGHLEVKAKVHGQELRDRLNKMHEQLNDAKTQQVGASSAHGEMTEIIKGVAAAAEAGEQPNLLEVMQYRLGQLKEIMEANTQRAAQIDSEIKMTTGALEENNYFQQMMR